MDHRQLGRRKDGSVFPLDVRSVSVDSPDGRVTLYAVSDVSEQDSARNALWSLTTRYQAQFKGFPLPSSVWEHRNGEFTLIDFNDAAEAYSNGEIRRHLGSRLSVVLPPPSEIADTIVRCHRERTTLSHEATLRPHRGSDLRTCLITDAFIPPSIVLSHLEDVTVRRRDEATIIMLSKAVEQTADSVIITDAEGVIEYVNPAFEQTTGFSRGEALGATPRILRSGVHPEPFYWDLWATLEAGRPFQGTLVNRKKEGDLYWCGQTITPLKDANGVITHYVSVLKDLTETRKRQEQEF
jgi:PAS domain S-box-containing protein